MKSKLIRAVTLRRDKLESLVFDLLCQHHQGLTEYQLLSLIRVQDAALLPDGRISSLALFQSHFLLFHTLYRLRDQFRSQRRFDMAIHTLNIRLLPYQAGDSGLEVCDDLSAYYGDLNHLFQTNETDVDAMLDWFWTQFVRDDHRDQALAVLELNDPVSDAEIRHQYRRLVMRYHPDRGGNVAKIQELNKAMDRLGRR